MFALPYTTAVLEEFIIRTYIFYVEVWLVNMHLQIVLRRLPRGMTWKELQMQLDPLPETEFSQFVAVGVE